MASGEKKISFSFSKSIKKPITYKNTPSEETKRDLIEYLDEKTIKVVGGVENKNEPLVIPMLGSSTWHERILNKVNANIFEPKTEPSSNADLKNVEIKQEVTADACGSTAVILNNDPQPLKVVTIKQEVLEEHATTLEEQAAVEILRDLQLQGVKAEETNIPVVPLPEDESLLGKQESTLEDYEQVPIEKYGEAMLRGMGWQPGQGIGKSEKVVPTAIPELRPRGMGLGADKLMIQKQIADSKLAGNEDLKIVKGAFVKIIAGKRVDNYGQIAGLDDECGRLMIKLTIGGEIISVSESIVQPISKDEYNKNAKVLNSKKYNAYKNNAEKKTTTSAENLIQDSSKKRNSSESDEDYKRKKSKKNKQYSSEDDSESERRSRTRRNSSDTDEDHKRKKSKKTKKSKKRNSSSERTRHKNKKKNKEKERVSRDSPNRNKYRHKRSRSRSPRRR